MKDRIEFRFTIATSKVEGKIAKVIAKKVEPYADRIVDATVKVFEKMAERHINDLNKEENK